MVSYDLINSPKDSTGKSFNYIFVMRLKLDLASETAGGYQLW